MMDSIDPGHAESTPVLPVRWMVFLWTAITLLNLAGYFARYTEEPPGLVAWVSVSDTLTWLFAALLSFWAAGWLDLRLRRSPGAVLKVMALAVLVIFARNLLLALLAFWPGGSAFSLPRLFRAAPLHLLHVSSFVVAGVILNHQRRWLMQQQRVAEVASAVRSAHLDFLNWQVQPHSLFNSLNSVSALAETAPLKASRMLAQLSGLLSQAIAPSPAVLHPLHQEIGTVRSFLDVESIRFGSRLRYEIHVPPECQECLIPGFLVQPLVENAVRHGIAPRAAGGSIEIRASRSRGTLHITVLDDGVGLPAGWSLEDRGGIGLRNTLSRLSILFPDQAGLTVEGRAGGGTRQEVWLPCTTRQPAAAPPAFTPLAPPQDAIAERALYIQTEHVRWVVAILLAVFATALFLVRLVPAMPDAPAPAAPAAVILVRSLIDAALWGLLAWVPFRFLPGIARRARGQRLAQLGLAAACVGAFTLLRGATESLLPLSRQPASILMASVAAFGLMVYGTFALAYHAIARIQRYAGARMSVLRAGEIIAAHDIASITWRVQPQLLVPAFNRLTELLRTDPERANGLLVHLATRLRGWLSEPSRRWQSAADSWAEVRSFVELHQALYGRRVQLALRNEAHLAACSARLPRLLLQSVAQVLVEGGATSLAFGLYRRRDSSVISVQAQPAGTPAGDAAAGIGMLAHELERSFGGQYRLTKRTGIHDSVVLQLILPQPENEQRREHH